MKRHLNTLYITSDDAYIRRERETFVVEVSHKKVLQAPVHSIENIVCFGFRSISPAMMAFCAERDVGVCYMTSNGRFLAKVYGPQRGNVVLRKAQYGISDDEKLSLRIAKPIVAAKVTNYRSLFMRHQRNHPDLSTDELVRATELMAGYLLNIERSVSLDELRGYEGQSAALYFANFSTLITSQHDEFATTGRSRRPPLDPANALLSFIYTILGNDVRSALETVGLDPQVGFLHQLRPGRPSLALDLMEEFRAYIGDRVVFNLINLKQVSKDDFDIRESGEVRMSDSARKIVITAYQKKKQEEIVHPFIGEKTTVGLLPHIQAMLLARFIRGDMENYPPFYMK